jgi:hypothetical protein
MNYFKNPIVCGILLLLVISAIVICVILIMKNNNQESREEIFKNDLKSKNFIILKLFGNKTEKLNSNQINTIYNQNKELVDNLYTKKTRSIFNSLMNTECIENSLIISFLKSFKVFLLNSTSQSRTNPSIFKGICVAFFAIVIYYYTKNPTVKKDPKNVHNYNLNDFCDLIACGSHISIWKGVTKDKLINSGIFESTDPYNIKNNSGVINALRIIHFLNKNAGFNQTQIYSQIIVPINELISNIQNSSSYKSKCINTLDMINKDPKDFDSATKIESGVYKSIVIMYFPNVPGFIPLPPPSRPSPIAPYSPPPSSSGSSPIAPYSPPPSRPSPIAPYSPPPSSSGSSPIAPYSPPPSSGTNKFRFINTLSNLDIPFLSIFYPNQTTLNLNQINNIYINNKNFIDTNLNEQTNNYLIQINNKNCLEDKLLILMLRKLKSIITNIINSDIKAGHVSHIKGIMVLVITLVIYYNSLQSNNNIYTLEDLCKLVACGSDKTMWVHNGNVILSADFIKQTLDSSVFKGNGTDISNYSLTKNPIKNSLAVMNFFNTQLFLDPNNVNSQILQPILNHIDNVIRSIQTASDFSSCFNGSINNSYDGQNALKLENLILLSIISNIMPGPYSPQPSGSPPIAPYSPPPSGSPI